MLLERIRSCFLKLDLINLRNILYNEFNMRKFLIDLGALRVCVLEIFSEVVECIVGFDKEILGLYIHIESLFGVSLFSEGLLEVFIFGLV